MIYALNFQHTTKWPNMVDSPFQRSVLSLPTAKAHKLCCPFKFLPKKDLFNHIGGKPSAAYYLQLKPMTAIPSIITKLTRTRSQCVTCSHVPIVRS